MDSVAIALQASEEAESEDTDGETDEGHHDPNTSDDSQEQLVHCAVILGDNKDKRPNYKMCLSL